MNESSLIKINHYKIKCLTIKLMDSISAPTVLPLTGKLLLKKTHSLTFQTEIAKNKERMEKGKAKGGDDILESEGKKEVAEQQAIKEM